MMRNTSLIVGLLSLPSAGWAQNLVVNPSFEEYTNCPTYLSQIDSAIGWQGIWISPDYFNACADDTMTVPFNPAGYQWPSDGNAYAGLGFYNYDVKEYMQSQLTEALQPGVLTYVSMRVSPGGFGYPGWTSPKWVASHIGLRLSTQPLVGLTFDGQLEYNTAVVYLPSLLSDTAAWTVLSTAFVPDSAYRYLQIGNFFADSLCSFAEIDPEPTGADFAYAFVDVVCVSTQSGICDPVVGLQAMERGQPPLAIAFGEVLYLPLQAWGLAGKATEGRLFDGQGRMVRRRPLLGEGTQVQWPLADLPMGMYVLEVVVGNHPSLFIRSWKY